MARLGYEQKVGNFRAKADTIEPEQDTSLMVQELTARLEFTKSQLSLNGKSILDYGCGTGLALRWLRTHTEPKKLVGIDISEGAVNYAKNHYPDIEFLVGDLEQKQDRLKREFDVVLCYEVLEHLQSPNRALNYLVNHYLVDEGSLVMSTPNRLVFSCGVEPSPINRTHIKEMDITELKTLLTVYFDEIQLWGMRFKDAARAKVYEMQVRHASDGYRIFRDLWWNPLINRFYRWIVRGEWAYLINGKHQYRWTASDLEFIEDGDEMASMAVWFFVIARRTRLSGSR